jgi:imidazolonepropionase-like amidohydrolase
MRIALPALLLAVLALPALAQRASSFGPEVREFVRVDAPTIALTHVKLIDGTGTPVRSDQTIVIDNGRIVALGDAAPTPAPSGAKVIDLTGYSVLPGLVGMHNHLFCIVGSNRTRIIKELPYSFPRLYLAMGVTTIRTTGCMEPYTDLNLKKQIDQGTLPGPKMFVTAPYLQGAFSGPGYFQLHRLSGPEEARRMVEFYADAGATSFKVYNQITRAELKATIDTAHKRGLKVTGHLCSVGYREAAALGIDNIEHGFMEDSEFVPGKQPDRCPEREEELTRLEAVDVNSTAVQDLFRDLIRHKVAVTSTLPIFEAAIVERPSPQRALEVMVPEWRARVLAAMFDAAAPANRKRTALLTSLLKKGMQLEYAFVKAGGTLLAGSDAVGIGGVLAGFADLREIEMLVAAGFTLVEAIRIATFNGAQFLGEANKIGTIAVGKQADLVVIHGDPTAQIADIEKVETVFKDGIGYDSAKLIDSVRGVVGLH